MKKILYCSFVLFLLFILTINSYSFDETEEIWNKLDSHTKEYLYELGIDEISYDDLFNLTPTDVFKSFTKLISDKVHSLKYNFIIILTVLVLSAIASSVVGGSTRYSSIINYICMLIVLSFIMSPISSLISNAATVIKNTRIFINISLPIMTSFIIASKSPALALTYNSFTVFFSNVIAVVSDKIFVPIISVIFSINLISVISAEDYKMKFIKTFKKTITIILSLFSTIFTGLLTTQSILARSSDSLVLKGIKFVSGTFIPIVGSGVGDALSSVFSSFLIMKNSLGIFVILVIILINLPVIIEILIWYFFFELCSIIASLVNMNSITEVIESLSSTISLLNIIVFFITFILVISTGIVIVMGNNYG